MCLDLDVIRKPHQTNIGLTDISVSGFQILYRFSKSDSFQALISIDEITQSQKLLLFPIVFMIGHIFDCLPPIVGYTC